MKSLVADIKTSHRDRTRYVNDVKKDTHELITRFQGELKEMARDLKDFLAKSEETRKKDFDAMMRVIQARVKEIKGDTKDLLTQHDKEMKELAADLKEFFRKSEATRMADFRALMKDVVATVEAIEKSTKALLGDYKAERKEATAYWVGLKKRGAAPMVEAEVRATPVKEKVEKAPVAPKAPMTKKEKKEK